MILTSNSPKTFRKLSHFSDPNFHRKNIVRDPLDLSFQFFKKIRLPVPGMIYLSNDAGDGVVNSTVEVNALCKPKDLGLWDKGSIP